MANEADADVRLGIAEAISKETAIFSSAIEQLPNAADAGARAAILDGVRLAATFVKRVTNRMAKEVYHSRMISIACSISSIVTSLSKVFAQLLNARNADEIRDIVEAAMEAVIEAAV